MKKKITAVLLTLVLVLTLGLVTAAPVGAITPPDFVGLWHLDEGSGTDAYDSSGNGNDGTITNATWAGSGNGMFGDALSFDGSGDYVDCGTNVVITTAITIEAWIKPSAFTNYDAIVANFVWPTNPEGYSFRVMANKKLVWRAVLSGNNTYSITSNSTMVAGNWYHVVLTHDASYTRLYINGSLDKQDTPGGTIVNLGKALKIGWDDYAADRVFNGDIDEVRIWDEARTATQIAQDYIDPVVTTEITSGESTVGVGAEESWDITINIYGGPEDVEDVVVQDGMGADLDGIVLVFCSTGTTVGIYPHLFNETVDIGKKTVGQGKHKMRATMVTWDVGELDAGDSETLVVTVTTGENPKGYQEFTTAEEDHELDGGASATYWYGGEEYKGTETVPLTVDVVEPSP